MTDARIHTGFRRHRKTTRVVKALGVEGGWCLLGLILWATEEFPSGNLRGLTAAELEEGVQWTGLPGAFASSLELAGWLDGDEGSWKIHDWEENNPWVAGQEERSEKARFNALVKHHGRPEAARKMPDYARRLAERTADFGQNSAASSRVNHAPSSRSRVSSRQNPAPSPSPSPSPSQEALRARASVARGSRLPPKWEPPADLWEWAKAERPDVDHPRELECFRDYWAGQPGAKGVKLDWPATYRNWIRRARGGQHGTGTANGGGGRNLSVVERIAANIRAIEDRDAGKT